MTLALRVINAGPACSLQDQGRRGFLRFGVTTAGPMDWIAHARARLLTGNRPDGPAIEIGPGGLEIEAQGGPIRIGVSADGFKVRIGASTVSSTCGATLQEGERITISPGRSHLWGYLAWAGETTIQPVMRSMSMHLRSGVGPLDGKALLAGITIPVEQPAGVVELPAVERTSVVRPVGGAIRFVPGPQADYFSPDEFREFCSDEYQVTSRSDRMGYRFEGRRLQHARGHDIVSDGIAMGAIQIPGDGLPIVLMADRQPTGGYPKIGTVIRADLPALAQARAGTKVRFKPVSIDEAVAALQAAVRDLVEFPERSHVGPSINLELLSSGNYASGVVNALAPPAVEVTSQD